MLKLIPQPKKCIQTEGVLTATSVCYTTDGLEPRLRKALTTLPFDENGAKLTVMVGKAESENYRMNITEDAIVIDADSAAGAFYAIQTLRQLFMQAPIPCLSIEDRPDFAYRGFYHDITRGRINTLSALKELVDTLALMKINSLQLYVEYTYDFEELKDVTRGNGCITAQELKELDEYCTERFMEFIPSLSTFGHLYDLLQQPRYHHLRTLKDFVPTPFLWEERMKHHTIDPTNPESLSLVQNLIDQYVPLFESDYFNICCDETFDLKRFDEEGKDSAGLYVDFVHSIIRHVKSKGKTVMMWADIINKHPETIELLPEDTVFLNWCYRAEPAEKNMEASMANFKKLGRRQIVCPGNASWFRFCEDLSISEPNIEKMTALGYRYGAEGVLNTNWGDWGHTCSIELAMLSTAYAAARSWNIDTARGEEFDDAADLVIYRQQGAASLVRKVSALHKRFHWRAFCQHICAARGWMAVTPDISLSVEDLTSLQKDAQAIVAQLQTTWKNDHYRRELLLAAQGTCLTAELVAMQEGITVERTVDVEEWLTAYSERWLENNKPSELWRIQELIRSVH